MDFFFFPGSPHTKLSVMRIEALGGVPLRWRAFHVRAIMQEMDNRFLQGKPLKDRYMQRDIERRAALRGLDWNGPPEHPVDRNLEALRVAALAAVEGWDPEFTRASFEDWFTHHRSPGLGEHPAQILTRLGPDAASILARVEAEPEAARRFGILGSHSFVVGEELFRGDGRPEAATDGARQPALTTPMPPV